MNRYSSSVSLRVYATLLFLSARVVRNEILQQALADLHLHEDVAYRFNLKEAVFRRNLTFAKGLGKRTVLQNGAVLLDVIC